MVGDRADVEGASLDHVCAAEGGAPFIDDVAIARMDQDGDAVLVVDPGEAVEELLLGHDVSVSEVDVSEVYVYNVDGDAGF